MENRFQLGQVGFFLLAKKENECNFSLFFTLILYCDILSGKGDVAMAHKNKTIANREQYVVKSNELIQRTRYNLTTQQQKIVLFAISKIKPTDTVETEYEFSIDELCAACGMKIDSGGYYYVSIKSDIKRLTERQWCVLPDGNETTISWIGDATIVPGSGTVRVSFHKRMAPYLFELREKYTQYKLVNVLAFKGKYTIRLYELLRSHITQKMIDADRESDFSISVKELREILMVESYPRWADFDRFILKKAVEEINLCADDIHIEHEPIKDGKTVSRVLFFITPAKALQQYMAHNERRKRL